MVTALTDRLKSRLVVPRQCGPVTGARREHCVAQDEHALARDICGKDLIRSGRRCSCREHRPCLTAHLSRVLHCLSMLRVNRHEKRP